MFSSFSQGKPPGLILVIKATSMCFQKYLTTKSQRYVIISENLEKG